MSENLDLVRSIYATWGRGDFSSVEWADPEIEFSIVGGPDPGSWTGVVGMAQGWHQWLSAWDNYNAEADEYSELDGERVLVFGRMRGRGRTSGVNVETEFANLLHLRNDKVVWLCLYSDRQRALVDLGLQGEAMSQNVDVVWASFDAHRAGGIEASLPFYSPDCVWDAGPDWLEDRIYRGHDGLRRVDGVFRENFEDYALTVHEIRDLRERVLALYEATGRIKGSGLPVRQPIGIVFSAFNDGRIGQVRSFFSWREALEAVGLSQ